MKNIKRFIKGSNKSFFLLGPRGTGKSTWLRNNYPDAYTFDLLDESIYQRLLMQPANFSMVINNIPPEQTIIIDEVQRLPNLLNDVHRLIEKEQRHFILCGSSARKLKKAGVNLLAGRALRKYMHPFLPGELKGEFNINEAQNTGLIPIVWDSEEKKETLKAYTQLYLKEEIQAEALVRNLAGFARFLPIAALYHAQNINVTNIARQSGVARTTVIGYLEILQETLLTFSLPAFEAKIRVKERKLPKLYWCDAGLVRAIKNNFGDIYPEERGALFEGLVAQTIRAYKDYKDLCDDFYYWAPSGNTKVEVDFIPPIGDHYVAVEVKSGSIFSEKWCKGLRAISELKNLKRRLVVYPEGPAMKTSDGIEIISYPTFEKICSQNILFDKHLY